MGHFTLHIDHEIGQEILSRDFVLNIDQDIWFWVFADSSGPMH